MLSIYGTMFPPKNPKSKSAKHTISLNMLFITKKEENLATFKQATHHRIHFHTIL